jgi:hypothetical protein
MIIIVESPNKKEQRVFQGKWTYRTPAITLYREKTFEPYTKEKFIKYLLGNDFVEVDFQDYKFFE